MGFDREHRRARSIAPKGRLLVSALLAAAIAFMAYEHTEACTGSKPPRIWGRSTAFGKAAPAVFTLAGPGGTATIPTAVFVASTGPAGPGCTPVSTTVTLSLSCTPPPPPPGVVVGSATLATPTPGPYPIPVPIVIPPGPPRICMLTGTAVTLWANGSTTSATGDIEICIVDPVPGDPPGGAARLDLQLLTPGTQSTHPGDQAEHRWLLTNNDPSESVTVTFDAESEQVARVPVAGGVPEPPGSGSGVYAIADPGSGDNFPIAFSEDLYPTPGPGLSYVIDDGTQELSGGPAPDGAIIWLNQFTAFAGQEIIDKISVAYGIGANGKEVSVLLYDDLNDDGDPSDAVLIRRADAVAANENTGIFNDVLIEPASVGPAGNSFFVGVVMQEAAGTSPAALDTNSSSGRSWVATDLECFADVDVLTNNGLPPTEISTLGAPGNWMIRANGRSDAPVLGWVTLPPDPPSVGIPTIQKTLTLCPGESREIEIASRSWPMCPPGSGCEQRVKVQGTFEGGDPALACGAAVLMADTGVPPAFECPDGGMTPVVGLQPPSGLDFIGAMPTHPIFMSFMLDGQVIIPDGSPPLQPLPPQIEILQEHRGRIAAMNISPGGGPAMFTNQLFSVGAQMSLFSKAPNVDLEILDVIAHLAPPNVPPDYFYVEVKGRVTGPTIPPHIDSFFDVFFHVHVDGLSGPLHRSATILEKPVATATGPTTLQIEFVGVFEDVPKFPPFIDSAELLLDASGTATGLEPPKPCAADINGNGIVGFQDLVQVLSFWGPCPDCPQDLDGDDDVGFSDLVIVLSEWGRCP